MISDDATQTVDGLLLLLAERSKEHAIVLLDPEGRITRWNEGAEHIFGIPRSEALGQPLARLFTSEEIRRGVPELEIATAKRNSAAEDDRWLTRADGSRFWATGVMVPLRDSSERLLGFGKILRNRTDIREQLEALRNQVEALNAASHRKDVFLSTLSHELRNPLAPLSNAMEQIRMIAPATPDLEYPLKIIERQFESLRRLVDDLLDVSRIGAGKIELKKERIAIRQVVDRAIESAGPILQERRHQLDVLFPKTPIFVECDVSRLEQVFVNLITNAAKYTPEQGRIWIKGTIESDEAVVHVQDNGVGISPDVLPSIFELFTQAESSRSESRGGLGVGLAVVKNLVTLHGGSVQVRSEGRGKGSEFSVRMPLVA